MQLRLAPASGETPAVCGLPFAGLARFSRHHGTSIPRQMACWRNLRVHLRLGTTHKSRWGNARVKATRENKTVEMQLTANGHG